MTRHCLNFAFNNQNVFSLVLFLPIDLFRMFHLFWIVANVQVLPIVSDISIRATLFLLFLLNKPIEYLNKQIRVKLINYILFFVIKRKWWIHTPFLSKIDNRVQFLAGYEISRLIHIIIVITFSKCYLIRKFADFWQGFWILT